jgi:hypothetical protein
MAQIIKVNFKQKRYTRKDKSIDNVKYLLKNTIKVCLVEPEMSKLEIATLLVQYANLVAKQASATEEDKHKLRKEII